VDTIRPQGKRTAKEHTKIAKNEQFSGAAGKSWKRWHMKELDEDKWSVACFSLETKKH